MKDVNKELLNKISREVMIKDAMVLARENDKLKRPVTRSRIEDLQDMAKLQDDWMNDF